MKLRSIVVLGVAVAAGAMALQAFAQQKPEPPRDRQATSERQDAAADAPRPRDASQRRQMTEAEKARRDARRRDGRTGDEREDEEENPRE